MKKKLLNYSIPAVLAAQNFLLANSENDRQFFSDSEDRIACISECNVQGYLQGKIASAGVDSGFVVGASYLYQEGKIDHLSAVKVVSYEGDSTQGETILVAENIDNLDFEWKSGFKVNAGYIFCQRDQLGIDITWTHLDAEGKISTFLNDPTFAKGTLKPNWFPFILGPLADQANAKWDCKFNLLDGTFGRSFFLGKWLAVHPYGGIRGVWIDQDYKAKYHAAWMIDTTGMGNLSLTFRDTQFDGKNDFKGVGFLFGFETDWYISCRLSAFTNIKTSLIYGKFDVQQVFNGQIVVPVSGIPTFILPEIITQTRSINRLRPNLEGEMGLKWEQFFCDDSYRFFVAISYEFSFWFFQNVFENIVAYLDGAQNSFTIASIDPRNLQFQGINVRVGFDF